MDAAVLGELSRQGVLGIIVIVLLFVCRALWEKNNELQAARLTDADKRLEDTKQAMASVTSALKTIETATLLIQQRGDK